MLLEILYPRKLAVVSAWVLPNCTPESEVSYERGGEKAKQTENPLYPAAAEKMLRNSETRVVFLS